MLTITPLHTSGLNGTTTANLNAQRFASDLSTGQREGGGASMESGTSSSPGSGGGGAREETAQRQAHRTTRTQARGQRPATPGSQGWRRFFHHADESLPIPQRLRAFSARAI